MGWLGRERFGEADTGELQFGPEMRICREKNIARVQNCPGITLLTYDHGQSYCGCGCGFDCGQGDGVCMLCN